MGETPTATPTLVERIRLNGAPVEATLSAAQGRIRWRVEGGVGEKSLEVESEVLGFEREEGKRIRVRAFVGTFREGVSCIGGGSSRIGGGRRARRDFVLEMPNEEAAAIWGERIRECIDSLGRPKKLLIIVNPFGGKKNARKIFQTEIKPLLAAADISFTVQETNHQFHAQEIALSLDLLKYDGIVCVSGDGILVEIVNGLLQREDWSNAIKVPLGIIPAGTGNGMAKSLLHAVGETYSVANATFAIIRGHKRPLDVTTVLQGERKFFSVLMLTWGFVADVDIESEKYRWMGSARLDFYCFVRVLSLRRYKGHVHFVPAPGYEMYGEPRQQNGGFNGDSRVPEERQEIGVSQQSGYPGPVTCFESSEWRSLKGPFILVWLNNVPWSGEDILPAPEAKFSDGYLDVVIIRDCPKSALLSLLLKMGEGSHVKSPHVTYIKVKAFQLEPGQCVENPAKGGIIDADGEVIARGEGTYNSHQQDLMAYGPPIHMTVDNGLATIFAPQ